MKTRQYKDVAGNPVTLDWLVKNEPEWAANQIRHRDKLQAELDELRTASERLNEVVEGVASRRWGHEGRRLKDTPEWCNFYVVVTRTKRAAESANNKLRRGGDE
jgi:hypothetical protein